MLVLELTPNIHTNEIRQCVEGMLH